MKQQWIDVLRAAALTGTVVQTFQALSRNGTERCAMGVLLDALSEGRDWKESGLLVPVPVGTIVSDRGGQRMPTQELEWAFSRQTEKELGTMKSINECPLCPGSRFLEIGLVMHLNDVHRMDFLTIANKLPVTPEWE